MRSILIALILLICLPATLFASTDQQKQFYPVDHYGVNAGWQATLPSDDWYVWSFSDNDRTGTDSTSGTTTVWFYSGPDRLHIRQRLYVVISNEKLNRSWNSWDDGMCGYDVALQVDENKEFQQLTIRGGNQDLKDEHGAVIAHTTCRIDGQESVVSTDPNYRPKFELTVTEV